MSHQFTVVGIEKLIPYVNNSRTHSDEQIAQIAASIKEFGFTNPVLIDETFGVIAGHGRILAARKLNLTEIPCILLSGLSDAQKKAYVIADNQLALNSGWNLDLLRLEIEDLKASDFDISLLGFDEDFLGNLFAEETTGLTDEDAVGEPPENPVTVLGDVWVLGNHRLICGDSTQIDTIDLLMCGGGGADMLITDPPYNVAYEGKTKDSLKIQNDEMSDENFRQFLADAFIAATTAMKAGAVFYIWYADVESYNFIGALVDAGLKFRQVLIWKKAQW